MPTTPTTDARPPYKRVADALRQEIRSGRRKPGEQMPSHRELQEQFEIANMTARSALRVLREEGLIYTVQGRGSYVMDAPGTGQPSAVRQPPAWFTSNPGSPAGEMDLPAGQSGNAAEALRSVLGQLNELNSEMGELKDQVVQLKERVEELEQDGR